MSVFGWQADSPAGERCPQSELRSMSNTTRNPARCQFTTVRGVIKTRGFLHPDQNVPNATQNSLCRAVNRVRGRCVCKASSCRRRAKFSRTRSSRERKELTIHPRKGRSNTIMARRLSEVSEFSFALSPSLCRCTTFGETQSNGQQASHQCANDISPSAAIMLP